MRAIFGVVVLLVGAFAVFGGDPFDEVLRRGSRAGSGCPIPLSLHVDRVDPRFELNRGDVRRAVAEAVAIWESATDTPLFRQPGVPLTQNQGRRVHLNSEPKHPPWCTPLRSVSGVQPNLPAIEPIAAHCEAYSP